MMIAAIEKQRGHGAVPKKDIFNERRNIRPESESTASQEVEKRDRFLRLSNHEASRRNAAIRN